MSDVEKDTRVAPPTGKPKPEVPSSCQTITKIDEYITIRLETLKEWMKNEKSKGFLSYLIGQEIALKEINLMIHPPEYLYHSSNETKTGGEKGE